MFLMCKSLAVEYLTFELYKNNASVSFLPSFVRWGDSNQTKQIKEARYLVAFPVYEKVFK